MGELEVIVMGGFIGVVDIIVLGGITDAGMLVDVVMDEDIWDEWWCENNWEEVECDEWRADEAAPNRPDEADKTGARMDE